MGQNIHDGKQKKNAENKENGDGNKADGKQVKLEIRWEDSMINGAKHANAS
jgi:hypothetical protein